jgi:hypothetical protein
MQYFSLQMCAGIHAPIDLAANPAEDFIMEERDFFDERPEQRTHTMTCPHCHQEGEYQIGWLVRRKKAQLPRNADERDRARFAKAQSYMVRTDDVLGCKNIRCRKRFDIAGIQSVAFL